jgi:rfaE bifunctional protein kinase chain/domain
MNKPQSGIINTRAGCSLAYDKVLVTGDVILDKYVSGRCDRLSPEAPVPVMSQTTTDYRAGGAANVALNCQAMGINTTLMGVTGRDAEADILTDRLKDISSVHLQMEDAIPTTLKTRFIADNRHILRVDREKVGSFVAGDFLKYLVEALRQHTGPVILSDYGKHLGGVAQKIIQIAVNQDVQVYVDPKSDDWNIYRGCFTITPNLKEYAKAGGDLKNLTEGCSALRKKFGIEAILLTLGGGGIFYSGEEDFDVSSSSVSDVIDVTGAGDTVIAVFVAAQAMGIGIKESLRMANSAAGSVCMRIGTCVVRRDDVVFP